jgi:hypothetical protein
MKLQHRVTVRACAAIAAVTLLIIATPSAKAATIIKLNLGGDALPDVEYNGATFHTLNDGVAGTPGDQNTAVEFLDFLLPHHASINTSTASYTLAGLTPIGPATNVGVILQSFTGGSFQLYDEAPGNALLLSGNLGSSQLVGSSGPPATAALFSTSFASVTGGSLAPFIQANSLSLSISMTDVSSGGAGPGLQAPGGVLLPFNADVTQSIAGEAPEPGTLLLTVIGAVFAAVYCRKCN